MALGTLLTVLPFASVLARFFSSRGARLLFFFVVVGLALAPIPTRGFSLGNWLYSVFDVPAVATVALAFYYWIWKRRSGEEKGTATPNQNAAKKSLSTTRLRVCGAIVLLTGVVLQLSETNVIAFDCYRFGYLFPFASVVVCLAIVLLDAPLSSLALVAFLATEFGLYPNFFDALLDPLLTAWLLIYFVVFAIKKRSRKSGEIAAAESALERADRPE